MVSSDLWTNIASMLGEILIMIPEKAFAGLSVMTVVDCSRLPQSEENLHSRNFLIKIVCNFYWACINGIYLNMQN